MIEPDTPKNRCEQKKFLHPQLQKENYNIAALMTAVAANVPNNLMIINYSHFWQSIQAVIAAGRGFIQRYHPLCMWAPEQNVIFF